MLRLYSGTTLSNHTKRRLSAKLYLKLFYFYLYDRFQRQNTWDISVLFHFSSPPIIYQRKKLSRTFGCILLSWISKFSTITPILTVFLRRFPLPRRWPSRISLMWRTPIRFIQQLAPERLVLLHYRSVPHASLYDSIGRFSILFQVMSKIWGRTGAVWPEDSLFFLGNILRKQSFHRLIRLHPFHRRC